MRMLARTPSDRFPTAEAFVQALGAHAVGTSEPGLTSRTPLSGPPLLYGLGLLAFAALVALILTRGSLTGTGDRRADPAVGTSKSVAVLPLVNVGGDPTEEYFSDGMTDELTSASTWRMPADRSSRPLPSGVTNLG